ncbi:MAG: immunoglobulin-like domain-containing protein [Treponema sp.]|nr:immunoglobulin-like domain-containing protein [Treponema sp.]
MKINTLKFVWWGVLFLSLFLMACSNSNISDSDEPLDNPAQELSEEERILGNAKSALTIQTVIEPTKNSITLPLSVTGYDGITVTWGSENEAIISADGNVTHQEGEGEDTVNLTATLTYNGSTTTKIFNVKVYRSGTSIDPDMLTLESAASSISVPEQIETECESISLPSSVADYDGVTVAWTSENGTIISTDGTVCHQVGEGSDSVTLTATLSYNGKTFEKIFEVSVEQITAAMILERASASLSIKTNITKDENSIELPLTIAGYEGVAVYWTSSAISIISSEGNVTHIAGTDYDSVKLTATLRYGEKSVNKEFIVKVARDTDLLALENAKSVLAIQSLVTKSENSITLPSVVPGYDGLEVSWSSGNSSIIKNDGTVIHAEGSGSDIVKLTATLTYNGKNVSKDFSATVHQASFEMSKTEILETAAQNLSDQVAQDTSSAQGIINISLVNSFEIDGKSVNVSWQTTSSDDHLVLSGNELTITRDIVDIPLSLTAHLSYDGETKDETIPVTVSHIPQFVRTSSNKVNYNGVEETNIEKDFYIFDENKFTVILESPLKAREIRFRRTVYSYTVDPASKTMTLTKVKQMDADGNWYTKSEYEAHELEYGSSQMNALKKAFSNPTIENLAGLFGGIDRTYEKLVKQNYFPDGVTLENAASQPESVKRAAVRAYIDESIEIMRNELGLSQSLSDAEVIDSYWQWYKPEIESEVESEFSEKVYTYEIDYDVSSDEWSYETWENNIKFSATAAWNPGKQWYEQKCEDWYDNSEGFYASLRNSNYGRTNYGDFHYSDNTSDFFGRALFNSTFTSFTLQSNDYNNEPIADEDKNWSITTYPSDQKITVSNGHGKTVDLYFRGDSFYY